MPIELVKEAGDEAIQLIWKLCQQIWESKRWPKDWKKSTYIPIPKVPGAKECEKFRTIALINQTSKVLLKNLQVLHRMGVTVSLEATMMKQRLRYLGHILRADGMEKSVLLGLVEGNRRRGRPRVQWMDKVKKTTGMSVGMLKEMALDRPNWRVLTHDVTMARKRTDGT